MKFKYRLFFPLIQCCLVIAALLIDNSIRNGSGEGKNQIIANALTNLEFYFKALFGYDDIVNYNFRFLTTCLGILIWFLIGYLLDSIIHSRHKAELRKSKE